MIGILAEKPSAARNFAIALGGAQGNYNGEDYMIVAARGHMYEFAKPEDNVAPALSSQYKSWTLSNLPWNEKDFLWKRERKDSVKASEISAIKASLSKCDEICIATDVDPTGEGELLAWEILDETNLRPKKWTRMYFDDESKKSVQKAFTTRKQLQGMLTDMDYVKSDFRCKFDYLTMQFTRIATKCGDGKSVLRQGRLKSAMIRIVGDQLAAIKAYKKVPYYQNRFRDENGNVFTNPDEPSFPNKNDVPSIYTDSAVIVDEKTIKHTAPPKLLDLAGLSSILSAKGIKAEVVLKTYQSMYNAQIVSYPRTEDKFISPEQFNDLLPLIDTIANLVGIDPAILTHRTPRTTHVKTGGSHGANRPGTSVPMSLDALKIHGPGAVEIYTLLARNYLAMLAEDYEYEFQKGHLEKYPDFTGSASVPKKAGYKAVFNDVDDDDLDDSTAGLGSMASPFIHEGFPPKPVNPTMKWLMSQLEKRDVGTGATRAGIYADVTNSKSKYPLMTDTKGKLSLTHFGDMSYQLLADTNIGNIEMTEQLQADMRDIAAGKVAPDVCLARIAKLVEEDIETMKKNGANIEKESGSTMSEQKEKYSGKWNGKDVSFNRVWSDHRFTDDECEALCRGEEISIFGLISKKGTTYGVTGKLAEQTYNGAKFIGFERTGFANANSTSSGIPKKWCEHVFTDDEITLLEAGKSVELDGCISKKGNVFACKVHFGETDKGGKGIIPEFN